MSEIKKALKLAEQMMTKDSLCEAERLEEGLRIVRAALSSAAVAEREPVVAAWQFKHYDPISGHPVWKTTLYWNGHRATEYRPLYLDPPPTSELEAENARLKTRLAEALKALALAEEAISLLRGSTGAVVYPDYYEGKTVEEIADAIRRVREGGKVDG